MNGAIWLVVILCCVMFFVLLPLRLWKDRVDADEHERDIEYFRGLYIQALDLLEANPTDEKSVQLALLGGRKYYGLTMPDTYTQHYSDGMPTGQSNHQNNAAAREASIEADIRARLASATARLQRAARTSELEMPSEKTCPRCAEQVKNAAVVCRFCGHEFSGVATD